MTILSSSAIPSLCTASELNDDDDNEDDIDDDSQLHSISVHS